MIQVVPSGDVETEHKNRVVRAFHFLRFRKGKTSGMCQLKISSFPSSNIQTHTERESVKRQSVIFFTCEAIHGVIIGGWLIECRKLSLYANKSRDEYVVYFFGDVHVHCVLALFGNDVISLESRPLMFMYS